MTHYIDLEADLDVDGFDNVECRLYLEALVRLNVLRPTKGEHDNCDYLALCEHCGWVEDNE